MISKIVLEFMYDDLRINIDEACKAYIKFGVTVQFRFNSGLVVIESKDRAQAIINRTGRYEEYIRWITDGVRNRTDVVYV